MSEGFFALRACRRLSSAPAGRPVIGVVGNLARDHFPGEPARTGGGPFHAARALAALHAPSRIYARCAVSDKAALLPALLALGRPVEYIPGRATASFEISESVDGRRMRVLSLGDPWLPDDVPALPEEARWVHVAPLLRGDFPVSTLALLAQGRRLCLDGQGLVRPARIGPLELDADFDPALLAHVWVLKLSDEEAAVLGDLEALPVAELLLTHGPAGATLYRRGTPRGDPRRGGRRRPHRHGRRIRGRLPRRPRRRAFHHVRLREQQPRSCPRCLRSEP